MWQRRGTEYRLCAAAETSTAITGADTHQREGERLKTNGHVAQQWLLATHYRILLICQPRRGKAGKAKLVVWGGKYRRKSGRLFFTSIVAT